MPRLRVRTGGAWRDTNLRGAVRVGGSTLAFGPPDSSGVSLFTNQIPTALDNADGADQYCLATYITTSVPGTVTHVRWPFPITAQPGGAAPLANVFRLATSFKAGGADVAFSMPGVQSSIGVPAWNTVALSTPVRMSAGEEFAPTIWTPSRYVASNGFFASSLTNGPLTAGGSAGRFAGQGPPVVVMAASSFGNTSYFVDCIFVPD